MIMIMMIPTGVLSLYVLVVYINILGVFINTHYMIHYLKFKFSGIETGQIVARLKS